MYGGGWRGGGAAPFKRFLDKRDNRSRTQTMPVVPRKEMQINKKESKQRIKSGAGQPNACLKKLMRVSYFRGHARYNRREGTSRAHVPKKTRGKTGSESG